MVEAVVVTWWILASVSGTGSNVDAPVALGPYPSQELCRVAGESRFSFDSRFWTEAHIAEEKKRYADAEAKRQAELRTAPHDKNGYAHLSDGTVVHFNQKGEQDGGFSSGGSMSMEYCPCYRAITACVKVSESK